MTGHRLGSWESFRKIDWDKEVRSYVRTFITLQSLIGVRASGVGKN